jgi:acyl carrier protein
MADEITPEEVRQLVAARLTSVLALDDEVDPEARFDEDLHADSLDLVEVIEGVERDLAERGVEVALADDELLELETVADAVRAIHAAAATTAGS